MGVYGQVLSHKTLQNLDKLDNGDAKSEDGGPLKPYVHDYNDAEHNRDRWQNGDEADEQSSVFSSEMESAQSRNSPPRTKDAPRGRFLSAQSSESTSQVSTAASATQQSDTYTEETGSPSDEE